MRSQVRTLSSRLMDELERVVGISRYHERMWIERDEDGSIKKVFDKDMNEIDKTNLAKSFMSVVQDGGFTYQGEFIEREDVRDYAKKRALGYQRRNRGHSVEEMR